MKTFRVYFEENGGEYEGWFEIETDFDVVQTGERTVEFNGTKITVDENIIEIEKV